MNLRRPLPLMLLFTLLAGASSCDRLSTSGSKESGSKSESSEETESYSEADKTQEMEDKAADINRQAEDLKTMEGSDQDKIDAYNKMQQDQQSLADEGDSGN